MPLLDTDVLSIVQRRLEPYYGRLASRIERMPGLTTWVSIITFEEQMRGWLKFAKNANREQLPQAYARLFTLNQDFCRRPILQFDRNALTVFESIRTKVRIGTNDLRVAAVAIANDELLITRNLKDFRRVPGLRVENWVD